VSSTEEKLLGNVFLANTDDPAVAAYVADRLGPAAVHYHPSVPFPPYWVRDQLKGPAGLAAYALSHCDHVPTLEAVATSEKRLAVQCALLESPYCTQAIKDLLHASPHCSTNDKLVTRLARPLPWTFADHIDQILTDHPNTAHTGLPVTLDPGRVAPIFERIVYLLAKEDTEANANTALARFAAAGTLYVIRCYLYEYYHSVSNRPRVFKNATLAPEDVLVLMPKNQCREAANEIASYTTNSPPMSTPVTLSVAQILDGVANVTYQRKDPCLLPFHSFTTEALEYLLPKKKWSHLLMHQRLTVAQAQALLRVVEEKSPGYLLEFYACRQFVRDLMSTSATGSAGRRKSSTINTCDTLPIRHGSSMKSVQRSLLQTKQDNEAIFKAVLDANQKSGNNPLRFVTVAKLLECLDSVDDPRLHDIIENVDAPELLNYVLGGWHITGTTVLPALSDLPQLIARLLADPQYRPLATPPTNFKNDASVQYVAYLLDTIEALAPQVLGDPEAAAYVYSRLTASSPPLAQAIDQFKNTSHSTLAKVCATITSLSRANPTPALSLP
jgi:hypothetical protein